MATVMEFNNDPTKGSAIGQMEDLSQQNPGMIIEGAKTGETTNQGIASTDINRQIYTPPKTNTEPISTLPEPPSPNTLDGSYADNFVSSTTQDFLDQQTSIKAQLDQMSKSGVEERGGQEYRIGGPNGFSFSTTNPITGKTDPALEAIARSGMSESQARLAYAKAIETAYQMERTKPEREAFAEQEKQGLATAKSAEFYSGRAGAGNPAESVLAKVEADYSRKRQVFERQLNDMVSSAISGIERGFYGEIERLQNELQSIPQKIKQEEDAYLDRVGKLVDLQSKMQSYDQKADQMQADRRVNASKIVGDYAKAGTELTQDVAEAIGSAYGLDTQDVLNLYAVSRDEFSDAEALKDEELIAKKRANVKSYLEIADKMEIGVPIEIGEATYTYFGYDSANHQTGTEKNKTTGEFFHWDRNNKTGEVTTTPIANIGADWEIRDLGTNGWWAFSPDGKESRKITPGPYQTTNNYSIAEGETPPPRPGGSPENAGQCGSYWGLKTGVPDMPDDFDFFSGKVKYLDTKYGKIEDIKQVQTGMTFLATTGTTGHIGFVGDIFYDPDSGEPLGFYADESNVVPPNGRAVSYSRPVYFKDSTLVGFYPVPQANGVSSGPDAPSSLLSSTGALMTGKPTVSDADKPSAIQEYEYAQAQGFSGTFEQWKNQGATQKPPTADESRNAGFAMRMREATDVFNSIESQITKMSAAEYAAYRALPNWLGKPSVVQQQEQAERNFINAVLRRESGAVISPEEFNNAELQYFPQPGDSAAVLKQKKQNRETALNGISLSAGNALSQDFAGTQETVKPETKPKIRVRYKPTGKEWMIDESKFDPSIFERIE